jgi:outer membrane receptor protein involved in Fe transport
VAVTGSQIRRNVPRSSRIGIEGELGWQAHETLLLTGNATLMRARIEEYTDEAAGVTYTDVAPVLTPALIANAQAAWTPHRDFELTLSARHVAESQLANDGNAALVTPAFTLADLGAAYTLRGTTLRVQVQNLFDATAYAAGYTDGVERYFFPVATRTVLATVALRF